MLRVDLEAAGIDYETPSGVIDFHALRATYVSHLVASGASVKTCQTLARHSTASMTIGIYAKASLHDVQGAVEARIGSRWTVRFSSDYNIDTATVIENRLEVDFREQCWGITAAFIDRVDEDEFRITINLLELGQYGFGRGFTGFQ